MNAQATNKLVQAQGELRQQVIKLIRENDLPVSDLDNDKRLFALLQDGEVVGSGGLETFPDCALVRSVSVQKNLQGRGLGKVIINELERISTEQGINCLYLLTTTAEEFFSRQGYEVISREDAPSAIKNTSEFSIICSSSSTLMKKHL
jgi:amino-acid N-acetyltransferase